MRTLTPKEQKVYRFIKQYVEKREYAPTYAEIQEEFGYKAVSSVQQYIEQLVDKGYLNAPLGQGQKRALSLVDDPASKVLSVPLEGSVAAGRLTEAVNNRDVIEVPYSLVKPGGDYFALKIKGDSMMDDGILDGDLAIIRRQPTAHNGQTVVAMVDRETTIKKYYRRPNHVELHPANRSFQVIRVDPPADFSILGVLSSVIRKFD